MTIIDPHTHDDARKPKGIFVSEHAYQPIGSDPLSSHLKQRIEQYLGAQQDPRFNMEKAPPKPSPRSLWQRYRPTAGHIVVVRDEVKMDANQLVLSEVDGVDGVQRKIYGTDDRKDLYRQFEPWATVLMIGPTYRSDFGHLIKPPDVRPGQRVLIRPTSGGDIELTEGDVSMWITTIGYSGIALIEEMTPETIAQMAALGIDQPKEPKSRIFGQIWRFLKAPIPDFFANPFGWKGLVRLWWEESR